MIFLFYHASSHRTKTNKQKTQETVKLFLPCYNINDIPFLLSKTSSITTIYLLSTTRENKYARSETFYGTKVILYNNYYSK